jgi:hypothetical protein
MVETATAGAAARRLSKTAQVLKYFAQQYKAGAARGGIPRKRLVKMAYLTDLLAREHFGHPLTDLTYYRYYYGPYDSAIRGFIDELVKADLADERHALDGDYVTKFLVDHGVPISFDFGLAEMEILRYVAATYLSMPMQELLDDVVYQTAPFKKTSELNDKLPMDIVNNRVAETVPFALEAVLRAEMEIDAGQFTTTF